MAMMKAAFLEENEKLSVREIPQPELTAGSLLIKVKACSICATDLRVYHHGNSRVKLPQILGHEIAGEVVAVSSEVSGYHEGDRVTVTPSVPCGKCYYCKRGQYSYCPDRRSFGGQLPGGFAEYVLMPEETLAYGSLNLIPDGVSFSEATIAEPLACCLNGQQCSGMPRGDTMLVIGGGSIGMLHCRLARASGAAKVWLMDQDVSRLNQVDLSPIDVVIDASKEDVAQKVKALSGGYGADVIMIACSSASAQQSSLEYAALGGRINFFGGLVAGKDKIMIKSNQIHYKDLQINGSHGSSPAQNKEALDLLGQKKIAVKDLITHTFGIDDIRKAFAVADSRQGMKVVIQL